MKKAIKAIGALTLTMSLLFGMTGCAITDVKNKGEEIMENVFAFKGSKITKALNEDEDDYEMMSDFIEMFTEFFEEDVGIEIDETKITSTKLNVNNDDATIEYVIDVDDEEFEFELELTKEDDEWVIADGESFIKDLMTFYLEVGLENGSKDTKNEIKNQMDIYDVSKPDKLASELYNGYEETKKKADEHSDKLDEAIAAIDEELSADD